jgi:hypothetical protein
MFALIASLSVVPPIAVAGDAVDYVRQIKPILTARCYACHSGLRTKAGLRLDTAAELIRGGDSGPAVDPGKSADSLLISMLTGDSGTRMPPENEGAALTADEIETFKKWIDQGARAPDETPLTDPREHWSYQPPVRPAVPQPRNATWVRNPVDAFIAAGHESQGLAPVEAADKATLLRRVYLDLIGLPPTRDELATFLADESPNAYQDVVDRLLARPQYGERWARHWMDVWRYSDWAGYRQEIRNSARHIWRWRDWMIESLNDDKGYDRMAMEMLAGDEIAPTDPDTLRATGFLVRNWEKFNRNSWLEATIEHTAKAFLGVTMNCCRCHDHKFDPIDQAEYYQFRAIFEPHFVRTDRLPGQPDAMKDGLPRVCDLKPDAPTYVLERGDEKRPMKDEAIKPAVPEVLGGALTIEPVELPVLAYYPALQEFAIQEDVAQAEQKVSAAAAALAQKQAAVAGAKKTGDEKSLAGLVAAAELATKQLATARAEEASLAARIAAEKVKYGLARGGDEKQLVLAAAKAECELALCQAQEQQAAAQNELAGAKNSAKPGNAAAVAALAAAEKKLADATTALAAAHAALADPADKYTPLGEELPRRSTGRRLAFARWLTARENPLAARVAVNHIWLRHFGAPLVENMFDFGLRAPQPRNQPLLDWLAVELMDHNWQMKRIHRLLVTSGAYRMTSGNTGASAANLALDRDNKYLWRMNTRRLEAELVRDSIFYTAGKLDLTRGGPDFAFPLASTTPRRSIYFQHAYEKQNKFLELFDGASVNECYRRSESIVPQQALALANSDVSVNQSRVLAKKLSELTAKDNAGDADQAFIRFAFLQLLSREPSVAELTACRNFLKDQAQMLRTPAQLTAVAGGAKPAVPASADPRQRARENLTLVLYNHNDFVTIH